MNCFRTKTPKGAVLLLVLGAVAILSILAVELAHRANIDVSRSARAGREAIKRRAFDSGVEVAKALLSEGRSESFDYLGDKWNKTVSFRAGENTSVTVSVQDECGKLNVAKAVGSDQTTTRTRRSLARLLEYVKRREPERDEEWRKTEELLKKRLGVDSKDTMPPLYTLDGLREAGISGEMVFGLRDRTQPRLALSDLLTVFGDGRINLNTAHPAVLYAIDEEYDENLVAQIAAWRGDSKEGATAAYKPFKQAKDLEQVEGIIRRLQLDGKSTEKNLFQKIQNNVGVQSSCFSACIEIEHFGRAWKAWAFFECLPRSGTAGQTVNMLAYEEIEP